MASKFPFFHPLIIFPLSIALRIALLCWGTYQDTHSPLKYTDIDYLVFTDASRYIAHNRSPYDRATYRYTPLLAWLLYPTTYSPHALWFDFGKYIFATGDIVTGYLIYVILRQRPRMTDESALRFASIWLLNPMVANISTRGSSEGLLAVIVIALLWAVVNKRVRVAGVLLGLGVHFKIYPFVYAASVFWWLSDGPQGDSVLKRVLTTERVTLAAWSFVTFMGLNGVMLWMYGWAFVEHSYSYHFSRIDHRHNFSVYNTLLHLRSATGFSSTVQVESLAFLPQLTLAVVAMPLLLAKKDLAGTMLAQTFAFVTFNKVCTSQYFLWYMVFLPFYLPQSSFLRKPKLGFVALIAWIAGQAVWLQQGFQLEFLGKSTFVPGLFLSTLLFFGVNCWILGIIVSDIRNGTASLPAVDDKKSQ